jgi:hypothetical protein
VGVIFTFQPSLTHRHISIFIFLLLVMWICLKCHDVRILLFSLVFWFKFLSNDDIRMFIFLLFFLLTFVNHLSALLDLYILIFKLISLKFKLFQNLFTWYDTYDNILLMNTKIASDFIAFFTLLLVDQILIKLFNWIK